MAQAQWLPSLSHFTNGNGWSGSEGVMRFALDPPADGAIHVVLWQEPFTRSYAEELENTSFPLSEAGLVALADWLSERAEAMNANPPRTPKEVRAWRDAAKAREAEVKG